MKKSVADFTEDTGTTVFFLQIVDRKGDVVRFNGGGKMEKDLVSTISEVVSGKIGFLSTKKRRKAVIGEALGEVVSELKRETIKVL